MSDQVTGVAYQAGAGFMAVYHPITGGIVAVKKRGGVVSAPVVLVPAVATGYTLNTVAWRAIGTDLTRYILGLHSPSSDAQDSYFEMAVPFDTGATVLNSFPEPQARLLPLQSGPSANAVWPGALSHVQDLGNQTFCAGLVRLGRIGRASGTAVNQYAIDAWRVEYPSETTAQSKNWGAGTTTDSAGFIPAGSLLQSVHGEVMSHGVAAIPLKPAFVSQAGGGALTALATYGWFVTVEVPNANGDVWRSPPSTPLVVTLTGANNLVNFGVQISATELANRVITVKIWQTLANGSLYRLMSSRTGLASTLQSFATFGSSLDSTTAGGEPFSGEVPATITPAFTHTVLFGGRMWGITRDFPELWMSKPLQKGLQPEFPGVSPFAISLSDEAGEPTGLAQLDDKLVVFKRNSIYFVQGDGPDNAGGGVAPTVTRIDSDLGSVVGGSTVSTGSEVFFVADRGIHRVKISGEVDYVGSPLDKYFNQVELGSPSVVCGAVFSTTRNEIRFSCSSGSAGITAFVYDRARNIWYYDIWGLGVPSLTRYSSSGEIRYTSTGLMYFEGNLTVSDDAGTPFVSVIGSAWIQGAGQQGRFRVRRARVLGQQPLISGTPTTPVMKIFYNFDESGLLFPTAETASPTAAIAATLPTIRAEMAPRVQKCTSFRTDLTIPAGSSGLRLEQWAAVIGIKKGPQKLNTAERWT
jgi:hypothetical protein